MSQRTKDPTMHARTILLPANVDAALVKAAKKEGRATRIHAAKLLAAALGLACLVLAGCSGEAGGPLVGAEREDAGQVVWDVGSDAGATVPDGGCAPDARVECLPGNTFACLGGHGPAGFAVCNACGQYSALNICDGCWACASRCGPPTGDLATEEAYSACAAKCRC